MATTKITDIIEPSGYTQYETEVFPETNAFIRSGIMAAPPAEVVSQMNSGGSVIDMPYWNDLARGFPDIMSDDDGTDATPAKITASKDQARKHYWHKAWSQMDLSGLVATGDPKDPLKAVYAGFARWWMKAEQKALLASTKGVIADNVANFSSDMVYTVYSDVASPAAANMISAAAVTRARVTMGDALDDLTAIAVHPDVYANMLDLDAIEFKQPSELSGRVAYFMGLEVITDDDMPVVAGTNSDEYTCYLFGRGAFGYVNASLDGDYMMEKDRKPASGNGGGQTIMHTRRHTLIHPRGVKFDGSPAGKSPTEAELAAAANWTRVYGRKSLRIAALKVNAV